MESGQLGFLDSFDPDYELSAADLFEVSLEHDYLSLDPQKFLVLFPVEAVYDEAAGCAEDKFLGFLEMGDEVGLVIDAAKLLGGYIDPVEQLTLIDSLEAGLSGDGLTN